MLGGLHYFEKLHSGPVLLHVWVNLGLPLERDGVVNLELRSILENTRDSILTNIEAEGVPNIREQEGDVFGWGLGENGGQSGQCGANAAGIARDGAIGEYENRGDRVDMVLDLSCNALLVELVMLDTVDQPRGVEDANLGREKLRVNAQSPRSQAPALTTTPLVLIIS